MAGSVDRKSRFAWRAAVAQPAQLEHLAVGQDAVDVGEACAIAHAYLAQLRPTFAGTIDQPVMQGDLRRVRDLRHLPIVTQLRVRCGWPRRVVAAMRHVAEDNGCMAMSSPFIIALTALDESVLHARARSSRSGRIAT